MSKSLWLLSTGLIALTGAPAIAQTSPAEQATPTPTETAGAVPNSAAAAEAAAPVAVEGEPGEIIITATRRSSPLSDVPIAVSAVTAQALQNAGATDIRGLTQLSPSLLVSSSTSEAVGGVARIRGIGTVGDNPGLESSVATFIDGVYRSRSGVALTELGAVERIEVLRGPQGTLFGRNASAGLINVVTQGPSFEEGGSAEFSYGNYDYKRAMVGLTGPISDKIAYRLDGNYTKRDGFLKESDDYPGARSRRFNNRDRWLARGQLLFKPNDDLSVRIIGDYSKRNEECCAATYAPARDVIRNPTTGEITFGPNSFAAFERGLGAAINDDPFARRVSVTPDRSYQSDVRDWGLSGEVNWDFGAAKLTSITAYRDWRSDRGQDADFNNLDILYRSDYDQEFKTFTQEVRLQGKALGDRLDYLVGGYYANETLDLTDNLRFGRDYGLVQGCRVVGGVIPALGLPAAALSPASPGCLNPLVRPGIAAALGPFGPALLGSLDRLRGISDVGASRDVFRQKDRTWALFTHNVIGITDGLSLTLGARYTHDRKTLDASIASDTTTCPTQIAVSNSLATQIAGAAAGGLITPARAAQLITIARTVQSLACANNIAGGVDGAYRDRQSDGEWTGTAVLSFKPTDRLLTYASYSKGYKAGGYNLDRAGFLAGAAAVSQLPFAAEKVDAFELGAKYRGQGFRLSAAAFHQLFKNFQLNTFNGVSFIVESIQGCSALAGGSGADSDYNDNAAITNATGACAGKTKAGVISQGLELEASFYPMRAFTLDLGLTYADTKYRKDLVGARGPLPTALFKLPGSRLSNAPQYTATGGATWTPALTAGGLTGLLHADARYQSRINTGSDLFPEKIQKGFTTVNARVGIGGAGGAWGLELWSQNLFDTDYRQVVTSAPLQGTGSLATVQAGGGSPGNTLFITFPAEPRTFGMTVRTKF